MGTESSCCTQSYDEENDFIKGYPKFKDWVEGKGHKQWWVSPKNDYLILLN